MYRDVAKKFNVTKARGCQMIALVKKLPPEIISYVIENEKAGYFTERKIRSLTLMKSDDAKTEVFRKMKDNVMVYKFNYSYSHYCLRS